MKHSEVYLIIILSLLMINSSCCSKPKEEISGGSCSYVKFEGFAVIKSITAAPASEYNCPVKPMQIIFEFTPLNISDRQKYKFKEFKDTAVKMRINDGANPPLAWIKKNGIEPGKKFRCFREEITKGTCTPVCFKFTDLNLFPETGCK